MPSSSADTADRSNSQDRQQPAAEDDCAQLALEIVAQVLRCDAEGHGSDGAWAVQQCVKELTKKRPSPLINFVDTAAAGSQEASPRNASPSRRSARSPRSPNNASSVGSPRSTTLRRIREQRRCEEAARDAQQSKSAKGGKLVALQHALRLSTLAQFDAATEARCRGDAPDVKVFHGLRALKAVVRDTLVHQPSAAKGRRQSTATTADASVKGPPAKQRPPPPPPLTAAEERSWSAALNGFAAMQSRPGSAAATYPALTYVTVVLPVAMPGAAPDAVGLTTLWDAARDACKPKRDALKRKAERERVEREREERTTTVPVKFGVKAPLSLPMAPYAAVPWLELLIASASGDAGDASADAMVRQTLGKVVEAAARPRPRKVNVTNLREVFDLSTRRQPGEADPTEVPLDGSRSTFPVSHSAQRAAARKQRELDRSQRQQAGDDRASCSQSRSVVTTDAGHVRGDGPVGGEAMAHRLLTPPSRLKALEMLMHIEDPPLHPEPFCAAPATLKAMAAKKAVRENARPEPTSLERAQNQATRAAASASANRLAALLRAKEEKSRGPRPKSLTPQPTRSGSKAPSALPPIAGRSRSGAHREVDDARGVATSLKKLNQSNPAPGRVRPTAGRR